MAKSCPASLRRRILIVKGAAFETSKQAGPAGTMARVGFRFARDAEIAASRGLCVSARRELQSAVKAVRGARKKSGLGAAPAWWPFGKKTPPKAANARHPMTRTQYYARTASGTYKPVDRPPSHAMAGARRKRKRRR